MALEVGTLAGILDLDDGPFDRKLGGVDGKLGGLVGTASKAALGIGTALAGGAAVATIAFGGFEKQMNEVFTLLPGITDKAMDRMTGQVKDFSREFGVLPDKVVPALYQALSAGVPQDNVFTFLEAAQKAAKGGVTELETAVDGISSVVNAYGSDVIDATKASDLMFTAVRLGKTNFEELSASLFNVTPTAAALGVKFQDVTAALAAMTVQGVPTSVATTQLRQLFVELSKEGTTTSKVFKDIAGKSFKDFIAGGGNVQQALELLAEKAKDGGVGINDLFGSVEAGSAALALTGRGASTFGADIAAMGESAGATQAAFEQMNQGIGASFDRIKAAVAVALIDLGEKLAPTVAKVADFIEANLPRVSEAFETVGDVIGEVVDFVQGVLALFRDDTDGSATKVGEAAGRISEILGQLRDTFMSIFSTIQAVVVFAAGIISETWDRFGGQLLDHLRTHLNAILQTFSGVLDMVRGVFEIFAAIFTGDWSRLWEGIKTLLSGVWNTIVGIVKTAINLISTVIGFGMAVISQAWSAVWNGMKTFLSDVWDTIKNIVRKAVKFVLDQIDRMLGPLDEVLGKLGKIGGGVIGKVIGGIPGFAEGVTNFRGGLAWVGEHGPELLNLPSGSDIIPNHQLSSMLGRVAAPPSSVVSGESGGSSTPVVELDAYLMLDGQALDGITVKVVDRTGLGEFRRFARTRGAP